MPRIEELSAFIKALPVSLKRTEESPSGPAVFSHFNSKVLDSNSNTSGWSSASSQEFAVIDVGVNTLILTKLLPELCSATIEPLLSALNELFISIAYGFTN